MGGKNCPLQQGLIKVTGKGKEGNAIDSTPEIHLTRWRFLLKVK